MARRRSYRRRQTGRMERWWSNRYLQLGAVIMIIIGATSFYIYQRVWVRNLVSEVEDLQRRNETAMQQTAMLRSRWMSATSIASVEKAIAERKLALEPTKPTQNMALRPPQEWDDRRYAGLIRALDKIFEHVPLIQSNKADAHELFQTE